MVCGRTSTNEKNEWEVGRGSGYGTGSLRDWAADKGDMNIVQSPAAVAEGQRGPVFCRSCRAYTNRKLAARHGIDLEQSSSRNSPLVHPW